MSFQLLLVEDESDSRELLARSLERAGHRCHQARSLADAKAWLAARPPLDLAIIDIVFAGEDGSGLDLLPIVQQAAPGVPIVVMTAFADVARVRRALNEGASYLLDKPFRAAELAGLVDQLLGKERDRPAQQVERALARAPLTDKERSVARLLLKGLSTAEIAHVEGNSEKTVRQHASSIYDKLGVSTRAELFHWVFPS